MRGITTGTMRSGKDCSMCQKPITDRVFSATVCKACNYTRRRLAQKVRANSKRYA